MKIKLKITKTLKRELKGLAAKVELDRTDYVKSVMVAHIKDNEENWSERIEGYEAFLSNRSQSLENLKNELAENLEMSDKEKQSILRTFYKENLMFDRPVNKDKKLENIMFRLEDQEFYALQILAENKEMTIENYTVEILQRLK